MKLFDIHSHLNFPHYKDDRNLLIKAMETEGVYANIVGTNIITSKESVALAETSPNLFALIGLHPGDDSPEEKAMGGSVFNEEDFEVLVKSPKVVGIGECGLDYFNLGDNADQEIARQKREFEKQIRFAVKHNKPLMIHCRQAYPDTMAILEKFKKEFGEALKVNFHFFTENIDTARKILDLGFNVSFTGVITFVKDYAKLVEFVPIERMMAETDAPYVAPVPHRGKRNEPSYVKYVVEKIASIKGLELEIVADKLFKNSLDFFNIKSL